MITGRSEASSLATRNTSILNRRLGFQSQSDRKPGFLSNPVKTLPKPAPNQASAIITGNLTSFLLLEEMYLQSYADAAGLGC